jgi:hypothetical protein
MSQLASDFETVQVYPSVIATDANGNKIDVEGDPVSLDGWDIQPNTSRSSSSITRAGGYLSFDFMVAFVPSRHRQYCVTGMKVVRSNGSSFRVSTVADWKSHLELVLDPSS